MTAEQVSAPFAAAQSRDPQSPEFQVALLQEKQATLLAMLRESSDREANARTDYRIACADAQRFLDELRKTQQELSAALAEIERMMAAATAESTD
jgi:glycine/D-amino acid oxidase-like deaminating enzyme